MRHSRLIWQNENGDTVEFSVYSPDYFCNVQKDVTGLSDVSAKINSIVNVGQDGETETSVYLDPRTITIQGSLRVRDYALQNAAIRALNRALDPHFKGVLTYILKNQSRKIPCRASTAPAWDRKNKMPGFKVTLFCSDPYWTDAITQQATLTGQSTAFRFPFPAYDASLDESTNSSWKWPLTIGTQVTSPICAINNDSDVDVGLIWRLEATSTIRKPRLTNVDTGEFMEVNLTMTRGDVLTVTTAYGKKRIRLFHNGKDTNAYSKIVFGSTFFQLPRGETNLCFSAQTGQSSSHCYVSYDSKYLGVGL